MNRGIPWIAAGLTALLAAACGREAPALPEEPPGLLMVGRTVGLSRLLERLSSLEGTPLGQAAQRLSDQLPNCVLVESQAVDGQLETLWKNLRCAPPRSRLDRLHAELRSAAAAFSSPLASGSRIRGRISFDYLDYAEIEISIPNELATGVAGMLLPGDEPPGPPLLSGMNALVHARLRPSAGLDLAALVPEGGQGDRMFRLKSEIFAGAVLDGTWEAAIYLPEDGERMPRAALALGFRARDPAVAAADEFISQLEKTWSIRRAAFRRRNAEGACLPELRILPDLAPCYVATDRALVVGWNTASIDKALDGRVGSLGTAGGMLVELARFPEADERLAEAAGVPAVVMAPGPWGRLRAIGRKEKDGVRLRLHLEPRGGA